GIPGPREWGIQPYGQYDVPSPVIAPQVRSAPADADKEGGRKASSSFPSFDVPNLRSWLKSRRADILFYKAFRSEGLVVAAMFKGVFDLSCQALRYLTSRGFWQGKCVAVSRLRTENHRLRVGA